MQLINPEAERAFAEANPHIIAGGRALYGVIWEGLRYVCGLTNIPDAAKRLDAPAALLSRFFKDLKKGRPGTFDAWVAADPCLIEAYWLHVRHPMGLPAQPVAVRAHAGLDLDLSDLDLSDLIGPDLDLSDLMVPDLDLSDLAAPDLDLPAATA